MSEIRLNSYHIMWLFVFYDLPTTTKKEIKDAALFRKLLERDGFVMMQYSVYTRYCGSKESADVHIKRIENILPQAGKVSVMTITDKQYGNIKNFWGEISAKKASIPQQLEIF